MNAKQYQGTLVFTELSRNTKIPYKRTKLIYRSGACALPVSLGFDFVSNRYTYRVVGQWIDGTWTVTSDRSHLVPDGEPLHMPNCIETMKVDLGVMCDVGVIRMSGVWIEEGIRYEMEYTGYLISNVDYTEKETV